jgi:UDP-N-acetyl-D-glucosamine dehydrogenase
MQRVVVVGQGYVGLPLAMQAVSVGYEVVGFDLDQRRVQRLASGDSFVEDIESDVLRAALASGHYTVSTDPQSCAGFDIAVITVPTPLRDSSPDLSYIESAAEILAKHLRPGATVILESTTYPGTTEELMLPILERGSGLKAGADFSAGYSPERIDPGNRTWTFATTPKVVSGIDPTSCEKVASFYGSMIDTVVPVTSTQTAELTKLLENTFRHVNVALVNELAMFCKDLGVDVWEAIDAAATKPFGFMKFTPGPGVGGHCLPIDPTYLSWRVKQALGRPFRFVHLANDVNEHMPDFVAQRLLLALNKHGKAISRSRILCLGLAYKPNSGDARESPATEVVRLLVELGAQVRAVDPHVVEEPHGIPASVVRAELTEEEVRAADAVVVLTNHAAFDYAMVAKLATYVFDSRHAIPLGSGDHVEYL